MHLRDGLVITRDMAEDELQRLKAQAKEDRKLLKQAEQVLGEIDRGPGLTDEHADVLAALRIRIEGKERKSLDELLSVAGDISGKKDLKDVLTTPDDEPKSDWPVIEDKKKDWPGL
jgi:hypothetical protein